MFEIEFDLCWRAEINIQVGLTYMSTSGMHRRLFEGRHLVSEGIIKKISYERTAQKKKKKNSGGKRLTDCVHGTPSQELSLSRDFKSKTERVYTP